MPTYRFICKECAKSCTVWSLSEKTIKDLPLDKLKCRVCGGETTRKPQGPSTQIMEKLDNGLMPKAVERLANAEELYAARGLNSDPLSGGAKYELPKT